MAHRWNKDAHASGYDIIDAGHRLVIDAINQMKAYDRSRGERDEVGDWLAVLENHLARQFLHEESLMTLSRSPRLGDQADEHRRMLDTLASLRWQHAAGDDVATLLTLNLVTFLESHLRGMDAEEFGSETTPRRVA